MRLEITDISNGWLVKDDDSSGNGVAFTFEDGENDEATRMNENEATRKLLRYVLDGIGYTYQGFSIHNIDIRTDLKGDEL